jgi:hypothetical protein
MRWNFLPKLPTLVDLREGVCLLLLCGAMVFSVLNIGVHRLAEPLWKPINHGLSPDGKEYVSISLAGLRVHDVETGRETQRVTWRSPWECVDWPRSEFSPDNAYLFEGRDESTSFSDEYGREHEARVTTDLSLSKRFVIGKFPGGCSLWWDRKLNQVQVRCFPENLLLRCFVDEPSDRYWLECIKYPRPVVIRKTMDRVRDFHTDSLLARTTDVWEMRLSDNAQLALHSDLKLGAPVNNDFRLRLVAERGGENPQLLLWKKFLRGEPAATPLATHWFLGELEECQISYQDGQIRIDQFEDRLTLPHADIADLGDLSPRMLKYQKSPDRSCPSTVGAIQSYLNEPYLGILQADRPNEYRFSAIEFNDRLRDVLCIDNNGQNVLRAADEEGRVFDIPTTASGASKRRKMWLAPYPYAFLFSLTAFGLATVVWIANAAARRSLLDPHGWFVLLVVFLWPLFCWATEQSTHYDDVAFGFRMIVLTSCALIWSLTAILFVTRDRVFRPLCISAAMGLSSYYVCTLGSWAYGNSGF